MVFTKQDTEKLKLVVKDFPKMYDMTVPEFKNTRRKDYMCISLIKK